MSENEGNWPGKVEPYRAAKENVDALLNGDSLTDGERAVVEAIREGFAGVAQILDKVAYAARKGGAA
jgi:hypothetical protein